MKNKNKVVFIAVVLIVVFLYIFYNIKKIDAENLAENVVISEKTWTYENIWTEYGRRGFMIENKNKVPVDLIMTVSVYGSNGGYSHADKIAINAVAPQSKFFFEREFGTQIERVELTEYECKKSGYQTLKGADIKVSTDEDGTKLLISAKNNSSKDTSGCICTAVFYDENDKIMDAETIEMHNGKIPSGETVTEEIHRPLDCDSIKIFTNAYTN